MVNKILLAIISSIFSVGIYKYIHSKSNYKISRFNINNISIGDNILIVGKKHKGKSTLIHKIITNINIPYDAVNTIINPTEILDNFYKQRYSHSIIYDRYSPGIISKLIKNQKNPDANTEAVVVFDNCLFTKEDSKLSELITNSYYYKILNIFSMIIPYDFTNKFKTNIDYIFLLNDDHILSKRLIYNEYISEFGISLKTFEEIFERYTQNYSSLVIDFRNNDIMYY